MLMPVVVFSLLKGILQNIFNIKSNKKMKKNCFFLTVLAVLLLFANNNLQSQEVFYPSTPAGVVWPTVPFGGAINGYSTGIKPDYMPTLDCSPYMLVGYVNFQYAGTGTAPANWNLSDVQCYGSATQVLSSNVPYTAGSVYNTNNVYSIVKNPQSISGGTFQNINAPGGFFVMHDGIYNALTYTISGLKSPYLDYDLNVTPSQMPPGLIYYVRIRLHNFGTQGGCSSAGNLQVEFRTPSGTSYTNVSGGLFYDKNRNRGENGRWMSQSPVCSGNNQTNRSWDGRGTFTDNPVGYDSSTATLEGCFAVGAGSEHYAANNGFQITIKSPERSGDNIFGIESIEVYGCLDLRVEAKGEDGYAATSFCENATVNLTAIGNFGSNIKWYKGDTWAQASANPSIGTGQNITVTAPSVAGNSETYWADGPYGRESVKIYAVYCCTAFGQTNTVFEENFTNVTWQNITGCGVNGLNEFHHAQSGNISSNYSYSTNCMIDDGKYAIVKTTSAGGYWGTGSNNNLGNPEIYEHTNPTNSGTPWTQLTIGNNPSGMLMVNAGAPQTNDYFYQHTVNELCSSTMYEFSAWYANASPAITNNFPNVLFEIVDANSNVVASKPTGPVQNDGNWYKTILSFSTAGYTAPFRFRLTNNVSATAGNDILIDDILITKCMPTLHLYEEGTTNTSIQVCSSNPVNITLELPADIANVISSSGTVYYQLMSSTNQINWTTVGTVQSISGAGTITFSITPPASGTVYYRVKLSADAGRAANINLSLADGCFNDVISLSFDITKGSGSMGAVTISPSSGTLTCDVSSITVTASGGSTYVWKKGTEIVGNSASLTITEPGTYTVTATEDGCSGSTSITIGGDSSLPNANITNNSGTTVLTCTTSSVSVTASGGVSYSWNDGNTNAARTLTAAGLYTVTVTNASNCEAQASINITEDKTPPTVNINSSGTELNCTASSITLTATGNGVSYLWNDGVTGATRTVTAAGTYTVTATGANGCTNTSQPVTITASDAMPTSSTITAVICEGEVYSDNGFYETQTGNYNRVITNGNSKGCDSTIYLNLTVIALPNVDFPPLEPICADATDFTLEVAYSGNVGITFTSYAITFDSKATEAGFVNQSGLLFGNQINIPMPLNVYPDYYSGTVLLSDASSGCQKTVNLKFDVYYSKNIMQQKWDNVIALLNEYYNGGYQFAGYQWYRNGELMTGETYSYIYLKNGAKLSSDDCYSVEITRLDGSQMFSCCLPVREALPLISEFAIIVGGEVIKITPVPQNATVRLLTVTGIVLQNHKVNASDFEIATPQQQGVYLLEIVTEINSERKVYPIVVK